MFWTKLFFLNVSILFYAVEITASSNTGRRLFKEVGFLVKSAKYTGHPPVIGSLFAIPLRRKPAPDIDPQPIKAVILKNPFLIIEKLNLAF